jgi:predicted alpha/beta-hydrolase family hydrolase
MATRSSGTVLLFPGAGSGRDQSTLVAVERAVAPTWSTVRADFAYRREGRRAPDRTPKLLATVREELAAIRAERVVVGGRSMGGRMCSMVAAGADGEPPPAELRGVVAISYPLHPPGKPDNLRVEHLPQIQVPCLFVHGTRDPFGSPDELEHWTATIPGPVTHHWIDGGRHDLKGADVEVAGAVVDWLATALSGRRRSRRGG